jgi:stage II sporulation protein M
MLAYFRQGLNGYIKNNIVKFFFVILIFSIGVVFGAMAIKVLPDGQKSELAGYLNIFFQDIATHTEYGLDLFLTVLWNNLKIIFLIWILGFTIIGVPFILFIVFTRGFIIGFTVGLLVNEFVLKGLLFAFVAILPHNFIAVPILILMSIFSISFSIQIINKKKQINSKLLANSINYSIICLILCVGMLVSSLVEVYISPVFMKLVAGLF